MANLAAQFRAGHPGKGVLRRTRHSIHLDAGGGQRVALFTRALHYHDGANWQEIETDWEDAAEADFTDRADRKQHRLLARADATWRIYPRRDVPAEYVEFGIMEYWRAAGGGRWRALAQGVKNRTLDKLVFDGATVTVSYTSTPDGFKFDAVLKAADAPSRVRWPVTLVGLTLDENWNLISGVEVVGSLRRPFMEDANGTERAVAATFAGGYLEYDADVTGLVYPITIDPTYTDGPGGDVTSSVDTMMYADAATTNYGTDTYLWVGYRAFWQAYRSLIKFNLSSVPADATVDSATLSLWMGMEASYNTRTLRVYRQKRAWVEDQATWNIYSTGNNWSTAGGFHADDCEQTAIGALQFTSTEAAGEKQWSLTANTVADLDLGNGWLIKADTESADGDGYRFNSSDHWTASERPKLVVVYTEASGNTYNLAATFAAASATPDVSMLAIARPVAATIVPASATSDVVSLSVGRSFSAALAASSTAGDTATLAVIRAFAATIETTSATPDGSSLAVSRLLAPTLAAASATPDSVVLAVARSLGAILGADSETPNIVALSISGLIELVATMAATSATPDDATLAVSRLLAATLAAASDAPDTITLSLGALLLLAAEMLATSVTPDTPALTVARPMAARLEAGGTTPDISLDVTRLLVAALGAISATPDTANLFIGGELADALFRGMARGLMRKMR